VPPAKRRALVDTEPGSHLSDTQPVNHTLGVLLVQFRIVQAGKRRTGRGTECLAAGGVLAPETLSTVFASPFDKHFGATVRAALERLKPVANHHRFFNLAFSLIERVAQGKTFWRGKLPNRVVELQKLVMFQASAY